MAEFYCSVKGRGGSAVPLIQSAGFGLGLVSMSLLAAVFWELEGSWQGGLCSGPIVYLLSLSLSDGRDAVLKYLEAWPDSLCLFLSPGKAVGVVGTQS